MPKAAASPQIAQRVDNVLSLDFSSGINFREINSSLATVLMNAMIAKDSLVNSYFLGIGFGNFQYAFREYAWMHLPAGYYDEEGLFWNRETGSSLLIRVAAELGVIGIGIVTYVLIRQIKAYAAVRGLSAKKGEYVSDWQCFIVTSIVMFVVSLLRKDSLTNVHLYIFVVGALMLPISSEKIAARLRSPPPFSAGRQTPRLY